VINSARDHVAWPRRQARRFLAYAVVLRSLPWPPFDWFYVPDLTHENDAAPGSVAS
jgi:hypothetical protein